MKKDHGFWILIFTKQQNWVLISFPLGHKPLSCKWIFKINYNINGYVSRHKIRLVVRGFSQVEGIDLNETFHVLREWN